jgi:hypothetical protein|tara:strand:+ start:1796 stop:2671 length:876 start_codon:yes stop_codon:yes gene_type:complete
MSRKKYKISIFSLFRDSESYINECLRSLDEVELTTNADFEYFFYENDSKDNTSKILGDWIKGKRGKLLSETANEQSHGSTLEPNRMIKMARIRNKMADLGKPVDSDYSIVIDSDLNFSKNIVNEFLKYKDLNFSMLTPNVRQTVPCKMNGKSETSYYDSLSLFDTENNHCMTWSDNPFYEDSDRNKFESGEPIHVNRAFGGFAFIKSNLFNKVNWKSSGNLEHWALCDQLNEHGKIYFLPEIRPTVNIKQQQWEHESDVIAQQRYLLSDGWNRFLWKKGVGGLQLSNESQN